MNGQGGGDNDDNVTSLDAARERKIIRLEAANDQPGPAVNLPPAVKWLSFSIIVIYGVCAVVSEETFIKIIIAGGFIPARYSGGLPLELEAFLSPVTHLFLHGGFLHTAINVGTLMAFGAGLERTIGAKKMLALYFASGIVGAFVHFAFFPDAQGPLIGASGAISGLFGAVLIMMTGAGGYRRLFPLIAIWIGITLFFGFFGVPGSDAAVGWATHLGGFFGGMLLFRPVMRLNLR